MRRFALLACLLAAGCSSGSDEGDHTPPAAPVLTAPAQGALLGRSALDGNGQVAFAGTAEPGATVQISVDGTQVASGAVFASGAFSVPATVADGQHSVVARAADGAGNVSGPSAEVSFDLDATAPAAPVLTAPADGAILGAADLVSGQVVFAGTAEPLSVIDLEIDAVLVAGAATTDANGDWTVSLPVSAGSHVVRVYATDDRDNTSGPSANVFFDVDASFPLAPMLTTPTAAVTTNAADLLVEGTAEQDLTIQVRLGGSVVGTTTADTYGFFSTTVPLPTADGTVSLTVVAVDAGQNFSPPSTAVAITVDRSAPNPPVIAAPAQGATLGAGDLVAGKVSFSGTAEANSTVELEVGGSYAGSALVDGAGNWAVALTVQDGQRSVQARAKDLANNTSAPSTAVAFTLDSLAPAVPVITYPAADALVVATELVNGQVVVRGTSESGASVEVLVDGLSAGTSVGPSWSVAVTLGSGSHSVRAEATDAARNASGLSAPVSFTVDATRIATQLPAGATAPVTGWGQKIPVLPTDRSGLGEVFPGQANSWVLAPDFSLAPGFGLAYANGLLLYAGTPTALTHQDLVDDLLAGVFDFFPGDQSATDAVFLTPPFGAADGVITAAAAGPLAPDVPVLAGSWSGYLNGTSDSRLSRTLALTPGSCTFSWSHRAYLQASGLVGSNVAPYAPSYQVVLRDPVSGAAIGAPLFSSSTHVTAGSVSVTRTVTQGTVVLSFELRSASPGYVQLDELGVVDGGGPVTLTNADFEAGDLRGWAANPGAESQNVRSDPRTVGFPGSELLVKRTFYAPPAAKWGRMVDVFKNTTGSTVSTTIVYVTILGGSSPLATTTQNGEAVVGWDADGTVRDVGVVFGSGAAYVADGSPFVFVTHDLTVPPSGEIALEHFVVQLGDADGGATTQLVPVATADACGEVLADYATIEAYRADFEAGVRDLVTNL